MRRGGLRNLLAMLVAGVVSCAAEAGAPEEALEGAGGADAAAELDAPDDERALVEFLTSRAYETWPKEPEFHESAGPHGKRVRVFYSDHAAAALRSGAEAFPAGAAAVKELESGGTVYGWSVWVKVDAASDAGRGFFWYERVLREDGSYRVYGNARGSSDCVGCHRGGMDFDLSTLPFE